MKIINKVPHDLSIVTDDGIRITYPGSETPIRVRLKKETRRKTIGGMKFEVHKEYIIPIEMTRLIKQLDNILEGNDDFVVVSRLTQEAIPECYDKIDRVLSPGVAIRDQNGKVTETRGFTLRHFQ